MEFLVYATVPTKNYLVVYPGSAPGDNISAMINLFPNVSWYLVDPREFYPKLHKSPNVDYIESSFFEDRHILHINEILGDRELLLISDIRNMEDVPFEERENNIANDMRLQESWVNKLKPKFSQLKFRLPRTFNKFDYLDGDLRIQMFAPHVSAETRLVVYGNMIKNKKYDVKNYDNALHSFNHNVRPNIFRKVSPNSFLDGCYDCTAFVILVALYNEVYESNRKPEDLLSLVPSAWSKHKFLMKQTRKTYCS